MNTEIQVKVSSYGPGRKYLMMRYRNPVTGERFARSTGTANKRQAERVAAKWEAELREGRYQPATKMTWQDFTWKYSDEVLSGLAPKTAGVAFTAFNSLERLCRPKKLADVTPQLLSKFATALRSEDKAEESVKTYLAHLRPALTWAVNLELLPAVPKFPKIQRAKRGRKSKGRPLSGEEFDRLIMAVAKIRPNDAPAWERYLTGLWLSGLRLEESLAFSWAGDAPISVDLSGRFPRLRIDAAAEKGHRDRLLPLTPDFAAWLLETPAAERRGRVFKLDGLAGGGFLRPDRVSRIVSVIGKRAGIVVKRTKGKGGVVKTKYASCHDLRRSFATRWAPRVKPATLQLLMRHASIETTLGYYVELDADELAAELWASHGGEASKAVAETL